MLRCPAGMNSLGRLSDWQSSDQLCRYLQISESRKFSEDPEAVERVLLAPQEGFRFFHAATLQASDFECMRFGAYVLETSFPVR